MVKIHRFYQLFLACFEADLRRLRVEVSETFPDVPRIGRQLANVASKDGERLSAFLFIPVAVEERKAFVVRRILAQALKMVDDPGGEVGFAGTSCKLSAAWKVRN